MKISIITATYNSAKTIADTLQSIQSQTYDDYEIIIEDGLSKDNTIEICESFNPLMGDRLKIYSEKDNGLYDAMNKGIRRATGDIVGVLNSDDMYKDSTVLEDINRFMTENDVDAIYGNLVLVNPEDTTKLVRIWRGSQYKPGLFQKGWSPAHPTFYCKREVYEKYGVFDTTLPVSADFELMLRLIEINKIKTLYVNRFFVRMRMGGESTGTLRNIIRGNLSIIKTLNRSGVKVNPLIYAIQRLAPKAWDMFYLHVYMFIKKKH